MSATQIILPDALAALIDQKHWVVWRWETKDGKKTKVPYQAAHPERLASTIKPATWGTYAEAIAAAADPANNLAGIGFCLLDSGIGAFDLDHCRDPALDGEAARIWVIRQSHTRVLASINTLDSNYTLTMVHTAINRRNPDILSFATYDLSADGARTVNGRVVSHAILRLSIQALRRGTAIGEFQRNAILPITVNAIRTKPLPKLVCLPRRLRRGSSFLNLVAAFLSKNQA
jgi:hypothetical protein